MNYRYLSHPLTNFLPVYGKKETLGITAVKSLSRGDTCHVYEFSMQNHWGTHVDAPQHFFEKGKSIFDYPADFWHFKHPQVITMTLKPGELVRADAWLEDIAAETDLILIKSGWSQKRDDITYSTENPGVAPEVGAYIREKFSGMRMIGMDWISLSSFKNREVGRLAHQVFLDPGGAGHPVLIMEDLDLSQDLSGLLNVMVVPLRIQGVDSAPCTVIGGFK